LSEDTFTFLLSKYLKLLEKVKLLPEVIQPIVASRAAATAAAWGSNDVERCSGRTCAKVGATRADDRPWLSPDLAVLLVCPCFSFGRG
jgi:hypothetical protein